VTFEEWWGQYAMEQRINHPGRETMLKSGTRAAFELAESQSNERIAELEQLLDDLTDIVMISDIISNKQELAERVNKVLTEKFLT